MIQGLLLQDFLILKHRINDSIGIITPGIQGKWQKEFANLPQRWAPPVRNYCKTETD